MVLIGNQKGKPFVLNYTFSYSTTGRTTGMDYTCCRRSCFGHIGHHYSNSNCAVVSVKEVYQLLEDEVTLFQKLAY